VDLLVIVIVSLVSVPLAIFGGGPVSLALGLIFALFFPGYTLLAALFPKRGDLDGVQRLALSFGLSIAVVILMGLILNFTPWGISLYPVLVSLLAFIIVTAGVAWYRRRRLPQKERFEFRFRPWLSQLLTAKNRGDKVLLVLLVVAIIGAIGTLIYVAHMPETGQRFTEFYILGPEGKAENYPGTLALGEEAKVTIGIVNHEKEMTDYTIRITIDGEKVREVGPITLADEEKWEQVVSFTPTKVGENQLVEFRLYKGSNPNVYHAPRFWISVRAAPTQTGVLQ
jgi:uncharacterized membrane protein